MSLLPRAEEDTTNVPNSMELQLFVILTVIRSVVVAS